MWDFAFVFRMLQLCLCAGRWLRLVCQCGFGWSPSYTQSPVKFGGSLIKVPGFIEGKISLGHEPQPRLI